MQATISLNSTKKSLFTIKSVSLLTQSSLNFCIFKCINNFNLKNGKKAILILNTTDSKQILLEENKNHYLINIPAKAASTIIWP